jgi:IMP dehydrogenase
MTVSRRARAARAHKISGLPVVEGKRIVGIVTNRDLRFETRYRPAGARGHDAARSAGHRARGRDLEEAKALMHKHRLERVLVVNGTSAARADHGQGHPEGHRASAACKDEQGKLRVGARSAPAPTPTSASSAGRGRRRRARRRHRAWPPQGVLDRVRWVKKNFPDVEVIGGNIATADGARRWSRPAPTA